MANNLKQFPPGSDRAIAKGCACPVMDNGHGNGYMGQAGIFVISGECPLHGRRSPGDTDAMNRDAERRADEAAKQQTWGNG